MYDMYPWNQPADDSPAVRPGPARRAARLSGTGRPPTLPRRFRWPWTGVITAESQRPQSAQ